MNRKKPILVMGGGHQGLAMAAHLSLNGESIKLWNRSPENITELMETHIIKCSGIIKKSSIIDDVSCRIDDVLCDTIMVTVPAYAHHDIACILAKKVTNKSIIILNPGRTFGALDFMKSLKKAGCRTEPKIAETQTIVYTCRRDNKASVMIYALKDHVDIAALKYNDIDSIMAAIPACIRNKFIFRKSIIDTSIGNVGMILHCAPVLMNIGWIESEAAEFKYYYDGISPSIAAFLEGLDQERLLVGKALGYNGKSVCEWLKEAYHVHGKDLYECIRNNPSYRNIDAPKTINHRYIEEDVPFGLVPLESVANLAKISTPYVSLIISLASAIKKKDYRTMGRSLSKKDLLNIDIWST